MAEFQWWLLIVGLVFGAGLVWLVLAETARRDADIDAVELAAEAQWIADRLQGDGWAMDRDAALAVLHEHRRYLRLPPPDEPDPDRPARRLQEMPPDGMMDAERSEPSAPPSAFETNPPGEMNPPAEESPTK